MDFSSLHNVIESKNKFMITSHISPDGDSIGSVLAMTLALLKLGKEAVPVINDEIPQKYVFLPGINLISKGTSGKHDVVVALDSGDVERLGFEKDLNDYGGYIVNIDHHKSNTKYGHLNLVNPDASSVGEIVFQLLDGKVEIDHDIALNIFTSIVTDTGSMRYSNTTSLSLKILAQLMDKGVKPDYISRHVFEKRSINSISLLKLALDSLEISSDGKLASICITKEMMKHTGAKEEDTDGIINYAREIEGVEVAVQFKENEETFIKVGFRSNEWVDVSTIAEQFQGGGHPRAAGCNIKLPLMITREIVLDAVKKYMGDSSERDY